MSKKSNPNKQSKVLNPIERAILKKAQSFIDAEKLFWKKRYEVEGHYRKNASMFEFGNRWPRSFEQLNAIYK